MELIFEIGCEELPAHFVRPALDQMASAFRVSCDKQRIDVDGVETVGTPRRLTLLTESLADRQDDLEEEQTGPPAAVAFDDGEPTDAAKGFARGQGVDVDDLFIAETDNGPFAAAKIREEGEPTGELLPDILEVVLQTLTFPKSMRWANYGERFGRPVRWLTAVAGGEVVDLSFAGVDSAAQTRGHRFSAPEPIEVRSVEGYRDELAAADVVVDPDERRELIVSKLETLSDDVGADLVDDPGLVDEVVNLVENPLATRLDFSEEYLELPDEVLETSMRSHQRYFAFRDPDSGELMSHCGVIYNTPVRDESVVNEGNLRVLRARLDDAVFFWEKDRERSLESRLDDLEEVVWLEAVGSMRARTERMSELAGAIAQLRGSSSDVADDARRAGLLAKSDLVTEMVDEFTDLQGIMGREYALADGESDTVARAIAEQYKPEGAEAPLPETSVGVCVALAEKLDALVGCFGVDLEPTSSKDPYGLRRAALGVIRIVLDRGLEVTVRELVEQAYDAYEVRGDADRLQRSRDETAERLDAFVIRRLRYFLAESYPKDVVDAAVSVQSGDIVAAAGSTEALADLRDDEDFEPLALGFKRVVNILEGESGAEDTEIDEALFDEDEEAALWGAYKTADERVEEAMGAGRWAEACEALIDLKGPVDSFFDTVMVMADDPALRDNRLALLARLRQVFMRVADMSRIQTG
jgi:glycyl-tRNA synthetase beta chain